MKNVPGRRTDWHECQWLQYLHSVGLLRVAFRPEAEICAAVVRHGGELVQMAVQHVQHMQKAPTQMNLQIQHVIRDITGTTGLAIVDAIAEGQRDPAVPAKLRDARIKASVETIPVSVLREAIALGSEVEPQCAKEAQKTGLPNTGFDLRTEAYRLFGVEVTQVPGLEMSVLPLFCEVGRDLSSRWPTAGHLVSWLPA